MRVRAVLPLYPPASLVGSWLTTHEFLVGLLAEGHDVEVFLYLTKRGGYEVDGIPVSALEIASDGSPRPPAGDDPDVVIHHLGDKGLGRSCWPDVPHVLMVHGRDRGVQAACETADLVVFNSFASRDEVDMGDRRWVVAHPPISVPCPPPGLPTGTAVTLVNTSVKKGGETFRSLAASMRRDEFLGVRGGYGRPVTIRLRNVEILPPQVDMDVVYRRTRVLLMPSFAESWGRTGLEAMSYGIPVVAHPTAGLRESLGDAGIFVDRQYLRGWRNAIHDLADPDEYAAASARARAQAAAFDSAAQVATFVASVEALVESRVP